MPAETGSTPGEQPLKKTATERLPIWAIRTIRKHCFSTVNPLHARYLSIIAQREE